MSEHSSYRNLSKTESALMNALLAPEFPGRDELVQQTSSCKVRPIDPSGSLEFEVISATKAPVTCRVPVEAEVEDTDHMVVHVLLHVEAGILHELEIYKEDLSDRVNSIDLRKLRVHLNTKL
jgi:Domain of unknown function (DUF6984)